MKLIFPGLYIIMKKNIYIFLILFICNHLCYANSFLSQNLSPQTQLSVVEVQTISDVWQKLYNSPDWLGDIILSGWQEIVHLCGGDLEKLKQMDVYEFAYLLGAEEISIEEIEKTKAESPIFVDNVTLKIKFCKKAMTDFEKKHSMKFGKSAIAHELFEKKIKEANFSLSFFEGIETEYTDPIISEVLNHLSLEVIKSEYYFMRLMENDLEYESYKCSYYINRSLIGYEYQMTGNDSTKAVRKKQLGDILDELEKISPNNYNSLYYRESGVIWQRAVKSYLDNKSLGILPNKIKPVFTEAGIPFPALKDISSPALRPKDYFQEGEQVVIINDQHYGAPLYRGIVSMIDSESVEIKRISLKGEEMWFRDFSIYDNLIWKWDNTCSPFFLYGNYLRKENLLEYMNIDTSILKKLQLKRILLLSELEDLNTIELLKAGIVSETEIEILRLKLIEYYESQKLYAKQEYKRFTFFKDEEDTSIENVFLESRKLFFGELILGGPFRDNFYSIREKIWSLNKKEFKLNQEEKNFVISVIEQYGLISVVILLLNDPYPSKEKVSSLTELLLSEVYNSNNFKGVKTQIISLKFQIQKSA